MKTSPVQNRSTAFTLLELLVVIGVVGVILTMFCTGLARSGPDVRAIVCLSSKRQLGQAWRMYCDDNTGNIVPNRDGGNVGKSPADAAWAGGWEDFNPGNTDNTNTEFLVRHDKYQWAAYLGPYVKTASVFKCPSDKTGVRIGTNSLPRVRSVSMNNLLGDLSRTWTSPSKYPLDKNYSAIIRPALKFVFLDEHENSINDGCFLFDPDTLYQLIDYPGSYHGNGCTFVFADGHTEIHRWRDPRTSPLLLPNQLLPLNVNLPGNQDVLWLSKHAAGVMDYP